MVEYIDYLAGFFSGVLVTIIASYLHFYFSKKTLRLQLEQTEKNLKIQLLHEDRKKALRELFQILNTKHKTYSDFKKAIDPFLEGLSGAFLPQELLKELRKEIYDIDVFLLVELGQGPSAEEEDQWMEEFYQQLEKMSPEERAQFELEQRFSGLKSKMKALTRKHISET